MCPVYFAATVSRGLHRSKVKRDERQRKRKRDDAIERNIVRHQPRTSDCSRALALVLDRRCPGDHGQLFLRSTVAYRSVLVTKILVPSETRGSGQLLSHIARSNRGFRLTAAVYNNLPLRFFFFRLYKNLHLGERRTRALFPYVALVLSTK